MEARNNVIQFKNGKVSEGVNRHEREAMFNLYQERKKEKYNPASSWLLVITISWLAVYGAYQAVLNFVIPAIKMIF